MFSTKTDQYQPSATNVKSMVCFTLFDKEHWVHEINIMQLADPNTTRNNKFYNEKLQSQMEKYRCEKSFAIALRRD